MVGISTPTAFKFDRGELSTIAAARVFREMAEGHPPFNGKLLSLPKEDFERQRRKLAHIGDDEAAVEAEEQERIERVAAAQLPAVSSQIALDALYDFELFRRRYMGHISLPWHVKAAEITAELLDTVDKEFLVMNCPPGVGKSTLGHDISAWVTARNRAVRGCNGSKAHAAAVRATRRLRKTLERTVPIKAKADALAAGMAVDAVAAMALDYGPFRSPLRDRWRDDEFIVLQRDGEAMADKEPTWSSYGMDSHILGNRFDLILWDDLVTRQTISTEEAIANQRTWWTDEGESRLEPGGLCMLIGQRLSRRDLYRYALDMRVPAEDVEIADFEDLAESDLRRKYHHIVFPAHDQSRCEQVHKRGEALPWPNGCLLDPLRLTWRELATIRANDPRKYEVVYQQNDDDPTGAWFDQAWILGGKGADGLDYEGCLNKDRAFWQLPDGVGSGVSVITIDPSPTKYWAVQAWYVTRPSVSGADTTSGTRYLMALENRKMTAPEFLDYNHAAGRFVGLAEQWRQRFDEIGRKLTHIVLEVNAAQRFMLQYDHMTRWARAHSVHVVGHTTTQRKLDENYGVKMLAPHYQFGRYDLPYGAMMERIDVQPLIRQLTAWPEGDYDDQVMANWFLEAKMPNLIPPVTNPRPAWRPSWLTN